MRRWLTALLLPILLCASLPTAHAQQGDMEYFASFDGLERVIAKAWAAPITDTEPDSRTTPVVAGRAEATPVATPVPHASAGIEALSIFVYLFDSDVHAAAGFDRIDADLRKTVLGDPRAPMNEDLPLDGLGDQARAYMGELSMGDVTVEFTFATVQDGPFVYSLSGMFSGPNSAEVTRDFAQQLIDAKMDRMTEQYDQAGGSRGGLWSKLHGVQPDMPAGSTVIDFIIYPMPEATPAAALEALPDTPLS
jgi:hypothetical protein